MIDFKEHIYSDDPLRGHPDVRTDLEGVSYFFLGNGKILAAVQFTPESQGTPVGLLIMDPEQFGPKRRSLTLEEKSGLERTQLDLLDPNDKKRYPATNYFACWDWISNIPAVKVEWQTDQLKVTERFYCVDSENPNLIRKVTVRNKTGLQCETVISTGILEKIIQKKIVVFADASVSFAIKYSLDQETQKVSFEPHFNSSTSRCAVWLPEIQWQEYWNSITATDFNDKILNHYFNSSRCQIYSVVSEKGRVDASVWQYNREWVRDHSMIVIGLLLAGHHKKAGTLLGRLLKEFVTEAGDTIDSSEIRTTDEVELDQNGVLLYVMKEYVLWTGGWDLVKAGWEKIVATAEFLFRDEFQHSSGLLKNSREYWERHKIHGITEGFELTYQMFPILGLEAASFLASSMNEEQLAKRWKDKSDSIRKGFLENPDWSFIKNGKLVKRLNVRGDININIDPQVIDELPDSVPLLQDVVHQLDPDTSAVLPIVYGLVPADSYVAKNTMQSMEELWNQVWNTGGYGRYHYSSEPDSAGPWPFPSLFLARAYSEMKVEDKVQRILEWLDSIPGSLSGSWFEFYGDRISPPYPQKGIPPWTWAEMLQLLIYQILGIRIEEEYIVVNPKLIGNIKHIKTQLLIRNKHLNIEIMKEEGNLFILHKDTIHKIENDGIKIQLE